MSARAGWIEVVPGIWDRLNIGCVYRRTDETWWWEPVGQAPPRGPYRTMAQAMRAAARG